MKVLEAQSAILTNFEVQQHLSEQRDKYEKQGKRRGPSNYENIIPQVGQRKLLLYSYSPTCTSSY